MPVLYIDLATIWLHWLSSMFIHLLLLSTMKYVILQVVNSIFLNEGSSAQNTLHVLRGLFVIESHSCVMSRVPLQPPENKVLPRKATIDGGFFPLRELNGFVRQTFGTHVAIVDNVKPTKTSRFVRTWISFVERVS